MRPIERPDYVNPVTELQKYVPSVITRENVHVYKTMDGNWRAYLKLAPEIEGRGWMRNQAVTKLAVVLADRNVPFDFDGLYED